MNTIAPRLPSQARRPLRVREIRGWRAIARSLVHIGVTPNHISMLGLAAGIAAGALLAATSLEASRILLGASLALMLLRGFCNILDGVMAIEAGAATRTGPLYNEVPDRISDVALMLGAGYATGGSPGLGWAAATVALFTAYVRVQVELAGASADYRGLFGKPGRMIVLAASMIWLIAVPAAWHFQIAGLGPIGLATTLIVVGSLGTSMTRLQRAARELSFTTPEP
ncbi:CDP-alcohol phosphatidyltransferase family protein [Luteolibacter marinus]|uniref:CDP-alcohol phosphatidyltransferase family protein n=1 Tax=Luteolibacter marinus TaxID=2776705 RepID=UPI001868E8DE|nr:CDP-alcohol phosphatidyltransferase family protein [Luteolibacter marinus]